MRPRTEILVRIKMNKFKANVQMGIGNGINIINNKTRKY